MAAVVLTMGSKDEPTLTPEQQELIDQLDGGADRLNWVADVVNPDTIRAAVVETGATHVILYEVHQSYIKKAELDDVPAYIAFADPEDSHGWYIPRVMQ